LDIISGDVECARGLCGWEGDWCRKLVTHDVALKPTVGSNPRYTTQQDLALNRFVLESVPTELIVDDIANLASVPRIEVKVDSVRRAVCGITTPSIALSH